MTIKLCGSDRRILTFPAVHPFESIPPSTLLNSLLFLSHTICSYKSKFFALNKRNAREAIRQIEVLQIFLQEIRDDHSNHLPESVLLSFSELHLAFQKLHLLLQDSTREGARLWMLMESEVVATHFRILSRSLATALDVLPLGSPSIEVLSEVKELIDLLNFQARNARFEVDPDDQRAKLNVISILNQFEKGVAPYERDLKRVLEKVGIWSWGDCNKEIEFLENEIGLECSNSDKRKLPLLSSLMGLMTYCRCVLFDSVDREDKTRSNSRRDSSDNCSELLGCLNPEDFRCPISLDFMTDPVTITTGHTYDRSSILKWFRGGNLICPKTGEKLRSNDFFPNLALRSLIQRYCSQTGITIPYRDRKDREIIKTVHPGSLAAKEAMKLLATFLAYRLQSETEEMENRAAYEIRLLSKTSIFNRSYMVKAGIVPLLLKHLSSKDSSTQENAIAALLNISKYPKSRAVIVENCGLELILHVLKMGLKVEAKQHAAATLFYIAAVESYRKMIGEMPETIPALVKLIKDGTDRSKRNALVAIFGLLMHPENHKRVIKANTIPLLFDLLKCSDREDIVTDSLAILANLAEKREGTVALLQYGAVHHAVEILNSSTSRLGKEYCVSLLLLLAINGGRDVVALLVKSSSLMGSLYSLLSEGTSRASKKASALIRVLHEFYESSSPGIKAPVTWQEQFVHVL